MSKLLEYSNAYKPFIYPWAVEAAKLHEKIHWIEEEISLKDDIDDWNRNKVTKEEKDFITQILRMFTQSDVSVGKYYYENFIPVFKNNEIRNMLGSFAAREAIHQRAYALLNETLGLPDRDFEAFRKFKEMLDKVTFMEEAETSTPVGLGKALAKAVFNEGVSLFASFVMLLNFQRHGLMKGMSKVVEWSLRDESLHVENIAKLFKQYCKENKSMVDDDFKKSIYEMSKTVVALEERFIDLAYGVSEIRGLSKDEVKSYIHYITDRRLLQLGMKPVFKVKDNPIPWLEHILSDVEHTNFFENRVTGYSKGSMKGEFCYDEYPKEV